jgi:DNA-directed RNA polymerase sigma subunit (sigma70/sigma32)
MTCACGCGREVSEGRRCVRGHNVRHAGIHIAHTRLWKPERNALILERCNADRTWGSMARLARELGISRERVRQIYSRESKRAA